MCFQEQDDSSINFRWRQTWLKSGKYQRIKKDRKTQKRHTWESLYVSKACLRVGRGEGKRERRGDQKSAGTEHGMRWLAYMTLKAPTSPTPTHLASCRHAAPPDHLTSGPRLHTHLRGSGPSKLAECLGGRREKGRRDSQNWAARSLKRRSPTLLIHPLF